MALTFFSRWNCCFFHKLVLNVLNWDKLCCMIWLYVRFYIDTPDHMQYKQFLIPKYKTSMRSFHKLWEVKIYALHTVQKPVAHTQASLYTSSYFECDTLPKPVAKTFFFFFFLCTCSCKNRCVRVLRQVPDGCETEMKNRCLQLGREWGKCRLSGTINNKYTHMHTHTSSLIFFSPSLSPPVKACCLSLFQIQHNHFHMIIHVEPLEKSV